MMIIKESSEKKIEEVKKITSIYEKEIREVILEHKDLIEALKDK